jgi:succinyl-CoA synthetase beta subunit
MKEKLATEFAFNGIVANSPRRVAAANQLTTERHAGMLKPKFTSGGRGKVGVNC